MTPRHHPAVAESAERRGSQIICPVKRQILSEGDEKLLETFQHGSEIPVGYVHLLQWGKGTGERQKQDTC